MKQWIGGFAACVLGLLACNVEHYEDCGSDGFDVGNEAMGGDGYGPGSGSHAEPTAGKGGGDNANTGGSSAMAGTASAAGSPGNAEPIPTPCVEERDCPAGFNCNFEAKLCEAADEETCGELTTELACTHRSDCTPIYAGTNCSCGQDCECRGGEPGCVCERFQFFSCQTAE